MFGLKQIAKKMNKKKYINTQNKIDKYIYN